MYDEVARRQRLLMALHEKVENTDSAVLLLREPDVKALAVAVDRTPVQTNRLLNSLINEGYIRATIEWLGIGSPIHAYRVEGLTDQGLRVVGILPPEDPYASLVAVLEDYLRQVDHDPDLTPAQKEQRRTVVQRTLESIRAFMFELTPKLAAELLMKGFGLG